MTEPAPAPAPARLRCLITGGSRNLGRAIGLALARRGARVAFTWSRRAEDARETTRLLTAAGADTQSFQGSVDDAAHAEATVRALAADWGGLDVLVNAAGINQLLPLALLEEADWDRMMAVNVKGAFLFSRAALRHMIRARRGHILNVGSFAGERMVPAPVHYAASKAALRGFTEATAREVGRYGVQVNLLVPGLLEEGLAQRLPAHRLQDYRDQSALGRLGGLEEVAEWAAWAVSGENTLMTGARLVLDGGL